MDGLVGTTAVVDVAVDGAVVVGAAPGVDAEADDAGSNSRILGGAYPLHRMLDLIHLDGVVSDGFRNGIDLPDENPTHL